MDIPAQQMDRFRNMFKIRRTIFEMLRDRGYSVPDSDLEQTLQDFINRFGNQNVSGYAPRSVTSSLHVTSIALLTFSQERHLISSNPSWTIGASESWSSSAIKPSQVWINSKGTAAIFYGHLRMQLLTIAHSRYLEKMKTAEANRGIVVVEQDISSFARRVRDYFANDSGHNF